MTVQVICSNLFVAFVSDPLNLDLFPPHGSGVAVGGSGESDKMWGHGWLLLLFLLFESLFAFSLPSLCTLTLFEGPRQGGFHQQDRKKTKTKKEGEGRKEERGSVYSTLFRSWSCFWGQVIHTQAELGSSALPFTSAGQLLENNTRDIYQAERDRDSEKGKESEALFVYYDLI